MPCQETLQQHVQPTHQQGPSDHVWAGIVLTGKTELVVLNSNVTGERYAALLQTHLLPFATRTFAAVKTVEVSLNSSYQALSAR